MLTLFFSVVSISVPVAPKVSAQEDESEPSQAVIPVSITYTYNYQEQSCPEPYPCQTVTTSTSFSGSANITPVEGGYGGTGSGSYEYVYDRVEGPVLHCPGPGDTSHVTTYGDADMTVHYQFSIDNDVTGGPDTTMMINGTIPVYNSSYGVVEVFVEDYDLHTDSNSSNCGEAGSGSDDNGSVGFGCHFYSLDFDKGGSWTQEIPVTDDSTAKCVLTIGAKLEKMRIFGTAKGLFGAKGDQGLSNSKVVLAKMDKDYYERLSTSKPDFMLETATSDNKTADYEFNFTKGPGNPPKMMVVSLLWHEGTPEYSITNGEEVDGRLIPVYQALCVDEEAATKCAKWKKTSEGYEAEVNFEYGSEAKLLQNWQFMESEDWRGMGRTTGAGSVPAGNTTKIMADSAYIYYESYREMKYFETLSLQDPLNPLVIKAHDVQPECLGADSSGAWFDHLYAELTSNPHFGDLGALLDRVEATGGEVVMCSTGGNSSLEYYSAPDLPLWHEIGHYLLFQMYNPFTSANRIPHEGYYVNSDTSDAILEGFAGFVTMLVDEYYIDVYNDYTEPYVYNSEDLELDIKIWGRDKLSEENAAAGILWDFYDRGLEINRGHFLHGEAPISGSGSYVGGTLTQVSKVYPESMDQVSLEPQTIIRVIDRNQVKTLFHMYNAFVSERRIGSIDMDMIYVNHGVYADVVERNYIHDSMSEKIGESGSASAPARPVRYTPPPEAQGSYIVSDAAVTFNITINFVDEFSDHDYSYLRETKPGEKMYFKMPPEYYPSVATLTPMATDFDLPGSQGITIRSDEYWDYIDSNPPQDGVFKRISVNSDLITAVQYIQNAKNLLSMASTEYKAGNATGAEMLVNIAYLDNFEYAEAALEQRNATDLKEQIEEILRVELLGLIKDKADSQDVDAKISELNIMLDQAIVIVPEFPYGMVMMLLVGLTFTVFLARFRGMTWLRSW